MNTFLVGASTSAVVLVYLILLLGRIPDHLETWIGVVRQVILCSGIAGAIYLLSLAILKYAPWDVMPSLTR